MLSVHGVRFVGPLTPYAEGFAGELSRLGYTPESVPQQLRLVAHLSRWMAEAGLGLAALTASGVGAFVTARRACGYSVYRTPQALAPLMGYLQFLGVVGSAPAPEMTAVDALLGRYRNYLVGERGVAVSSVRVYVSALRPFLAARLTGDNGLSLAELTAGDVTEFMLEVSHEQRPGKARTTATALRSLLRFLHVEGVLERALVDAVPSVASWRLAPLPAGLKPGEVDRLLAGCDRRSVAGQRDLAIVLLLVRLGMRAGEVANLGLDDIDWRAGEIIVVGKGGRRDRLPLPDDVGQAIVDYLRRGRPSTAQGRSVFVRVKAPHRGLTSEAVSMAVFTAGRRAGLGVVRAHRLRHTAATQTLAAGGGLPEIGQLLRHRKAMTTAIYAKADKAALRRLARPWPTGGVA